MDKRRSRNRSPFRKIAQNLCAFLPPRFSWFLPLRGCACICFRRGTARWTRWARRCLKRPGEFPRRILRRGTKFEQKGTWRGVRDSEHPLPCRTKRRNPNESGIDACDGELLDAVIQLLDEPNPQALLPKIARPRRRLSAPMQRCWKYRARIRHQLSRGHSALFHFEFRRAPAREATRSSWNQLDGRGYRPFKSPS